jgi:hypothetical protein
MNGDQPSKKGIGMGSQAWEQARAARILCAVTFHFDASRLGFLAETLCALAEYPVPVLHVVIVTNAVRPDDLGLLDRLCDESVSDGKFSIRSFGDLSNPRDLAWRHKPIIESEFIEENHGRYTHFIYLEGDIRLSYVNFAYFIEFRELLRNHGLIPAFVRVEYSKTSVGFAASDVFFPVYVPLQPNLVLDEFVMVNLPNPYNPVFILDTELASEYVQSRSFDEKGSHSVCNWGLLERSAMGLCLERVPAPFQSRYVAPVSRRSGRAPAFAWLRHLPDNYANNPRSPLGKVRVDRLFWGAKAIGDDGRWGADNPVEPGPRLERADATARVEASETHSAEQYYLVSAHDTVLFATKEPWALRHAAFGIAPLTLTLEIQGGRGRLVAKGDVGPGAFQISFGKSPDEMQVRSGRAEFDCDVENFAGGSIGIRFRDRYLAADLDGEIRCNREWCRDWEQYILVRADTLDGIELLRQYSWLSHSDGRTVALAAQPIDFGRMQPAESSALAATFAPGAHETPRVMLFGPARLRVIGRSQSIFVVGRERGDDGHPMQVRILDETGVAHEFSRVGAPPGDSAASIPPSP